MAPTTSLLKLTADTAGTLLTPITNWAKVAEGAGNIKVMNLSALVIALRPEVQPGRCPAAEDRAAIRQGSRSGGRISWRNGNHGCGGGGPQADRPTAGRPVTEPCRTSTGRMVFCPLRSRRFPRRGLWFGPQLAPAGSGLMLNVGPDAVVRPLLRRILQRLRTPPPDLPSLLLKERIVLLGLPLFLDDDAKSASGR